MTSDNRISAAVSGEDLTAIKTAQAAIRAKLAFGVTLTKDERIKLDKASAKDAEFDAKCAAYMQSNPEFIPAFIGAGEVGKDRTLLPILIEIEAGEKANADMLADTIRVVKSEIKRANYAYYHSVEEAAKRGRPGAETIYNELQKRFPGGSPAAAKKKTAA